MTPWVRVFCMIEHRLILNTLHAEFSLARATDLVARAKSPERKIPESTVIYEFA